MLFVINLISFVLQYTFLMRTKNKIFMFHE